MRWMLDLNVVLDVLQRREPFYGASASILSSIVQNEVEGFLPAHGVTTIHSIVQRHGDTGSADQAVDWLLQNLEIVPQDTTTFVRARSYSFADFEDAALASAAAAADCDYIVTRNVTDFARSPVPAVTPEELLSSLANE